MNKSVWNAAALASLVLLSACGGGDGSDEMVPSPAVPEVQDPGFLADATTGKITLYSSQGDLQRYLGKWESGCLLAAVTSSNPVNSIINVYQLSSIVGTTIKGELTQFQFIDKGCAMEARPSKVIVGVSMGGPRERSLSYNRSFTGSFDAIFVSYTGQSLFFVPPDFAAFSQGYKYLMIGKERGLITPELAFDGVVYVKK